MFSPFPRKGHTEEDIIVYGKKLEREREQHDCPALTSEIEPASFAFYNRFASLLVEV